MGEILSRDQFGPFLASRGLAGVLVEVGTHRGEFARQLVGGCPGATLHCVDHYLPRYHPDDPAALGDRDADYRAALRALETFGDRVRFLRMESTAAAKTFAAGSVDFVYIDACHSFAAVRADLRAWWPTVRPGGILAGHDILCPGEPDGGWAKFILPAVVEFALRENIEVRLVPEPSGPWSFYAEKPL